MTLFKNLRFCQVVNKSWSNTIESHTIQLNDTRTWWLCLLKTFNLKKNNKFWDLLWGWFSLSLAFDHKRLVVLVLPHFHLDRETIWASFLLIHFKIRKIIVKDSWACFSFFLLDSQYFLPGRAVRLLGAVSSCVGDFELKREFVWKVFSSNKWANQRCQKHLD